MLVTSDYLFDSFFQYLFIWRSDNPADDLGDYFAQIMEELKTPLLHSMDAFLLPDTHDRIRCFREALRSGPGLMVKRQRAKERHFWNWGERWVSVEFYRILF
jgi:hypothetical protein